jgi:hypothetical protein
MTSRIDLLPEEQAKKDMRLRIKKAEMSLISSSRKKPKNKRLKSLANLVRFK